MSAPAQLKPGAKVGPGRFTLVKELGRGGMGVVWLAQDTNLDEQVALKFLPPEVAADPVSLNDLRRETVRSHRLTHPNIIRIHDFHQPPDGLAFISMEYVDGQTLSGWRLQQPKQVFSWEQLNPLVEQLCTALEYAHGEGVIHRDLKPANVMLDSRGRVKLADFGIAAVVSDSVSRVSQRSSTGGTLAYMSPQQLSGKMPSVADDVYALGATLYELLTGRPPFFSGDLTHQILHVAPTPAQERLLDLGVDNPVPPEIAALLMACLSKEPDLRPQSVAMVAAWVGLTSPAPDPAAKMAAGLGEQAIEVVPLQPESGEAVRQVPAGSRRFKWSWAWGMGGVTVCLLLIGLGLMKLWRRSPSPPAAGPIVAAAGTLRYGLYLHFDISTFAGYPGAKDLGKVPVNRYAPSGLNPRQWAQTAKEAGMTFAVLTAKHEAGFCLWDSQNYDYDVAGSPVKTDVVAAFVAACEAEGVLPGVHYSLPDARNEGVANFKGPVSDAYFALIKRHMTELHTRYPQIRVQVFDVAARFSAEQATELYRLIKKCNPSCVIVGTDGPDLECDTVNQGWFWQADAPLNPASTLFNHYQRCQLANKAFLLNAGVNKAGVIPETTVVVLKELKGLIAQSQPSAEAAPARWTNSLGMVFAPVPGANVLFCIWETRVRDYETFVNASGFQAGQRMYGHRRDGWKERDGGGWQAPGFAQSADHPVVGLNWDEAQAFCQWLTEKEQKTGSLDTKHQYRLPTDAEWSQAVGDAKYPWGDNWPPPARAGNYGSEETLDGDVPKGLPVIPGYKDGYARTSPAGRFAPNRYGLYDLGGNAWEWCLDLYTRWMNDKSVLAAFPELSADGEGQTYRIYRGGGWNDSHPQVLLSANRMGNGFAEPLKRYDNTGFRVVLSGLEELPPLHERQTVPASAATRTQALRDALVLHFNFDSPPTNGVVPDLSPLGNHGRADGVRWTAQGRYGGAFEFSGTDSVVRVPNHPSLNPQHLTLAAWIKTDRSEGGWRRIFDKCHFQGYTMCIAADWETNPSHGRLHWEIGGAANGTTMSDGVVADGHWRHVAAAYDGHELRTYVDGQLQDTRNTQDGEIPTNGLDLAIGYDICCDLIPTKGAYWPGNSFIGTIDEAMIFNRALSPEEVRFVRDSPDRLAGSPLPAGAAFAAAAATTTPANGLLLSLGFDAPPTNGVVPDLSGQGHHGRGVGVEWIERGRRGGALRFKGTNSLVRVSNNPALNLEHFTASAWIKTACKDGKWRRIFDKSCYKGFALSIAGGKDRSWHGKVALEIGGQPLHWNLSDTDVADGRWHHVAATFDGFEQRLYVDERPQSQAPTWTGRVLSNAFDLAIGCNLSEPPEEVEQSFVGEIDEVMLFNRALWPGEVRRLYESQK